LENCAFRLDEKGIDAIFTAVDQCQLPGAAVGIAINGKPVYRKGFGLASMELPIVLSPGMRMRIGSTTKHFAAFAYLLLCEEGKAGIDATVGEYLPELHPVTHGVTLRQLMGNTGGLRDVLDIAWQLSGTGQPVSSEDLLSLYRSIDDVNAAPGSAWIYNNGGWLILSVAIERITGRPLEDVLRERIFEKVGMHDTLLRRCDTNFVPNSATLHTLSPMGELRKSYLGTALAGEGGMVSTVDDMLRWLAHMQDPVVGSAATWALMKTPQVLANGTSTGYGSGLMCGRYRGVEMLAHGGGVMGGNSEMLKVPEVGLDIAIAVNRDDVSATLLARKIMDLCLTDLEPRKSSPGPTLTGIFRSRTSNRVVQLFSSGPQQMASIDGLDVPMEPDERGVLWPTEIWSFMRQSITMIGDHGNPTSIELNDFGNRDELLAVQRSGGIPRVAISGRFRSETTGTDATILEVEGKAWLKSTGHFGSVELDLECLSDEIWRARPKATFPPGGVLSFEAGGAGFFFSTFRTRALRFRRIED
jgi:CubicO group peptidase (beta-lactamase class C family)